VTPDELLVLPPSAARDCAVAVLRDEPDPYARALLEHLTASALVLDAGRQRVLLVHHAKLGLWVQPGGHVDAGDASVADAARREALEETGAADLMLLGGPLDLDRHAAPCQPPGAGWHLDLLYAFGAPDGAALAVSDESHDVAWFGLDALPEDAVPGLADRLTAALHRL
jgi:8-oxo-dGTP pyrophosphatase MutT (NUDIX family)